MPNDNRYGSSRNATQPTTVVETTSIVPATESYVPVGTAERFSPYYSSRFKKQGPQVIGIPQAAFGVATQAPNALKNLAISTLGRAALFAGGMYLVGIKTPKQLIVGSLASSATLSALLTLHHAYAASKRTW